MDEQGYRLQFGQKIRCEENQGSVGDEANISAARGQAAQDARVSSADEDALWPGCACQKARQGQKIPKRFG